MMLLYGKWRTDKWLLNNGEKKLFGNKSNYNGMFKFCSRSCVYVCMDE